MDVQSIRMPSSALKGISQIITHFAVLVTVFTGILDISQAAQALHYEMVEELPPGTFYKNIKTESGLSAKYEASELRKLRLRFLSVNKEIELFSLGEYDGILENAEAIDRDTLCPNQEQCVIKLEIAVQPPHFEQIPITITLIDMNDNAPQFPEDIIVHTLSESTPQGVLFPILPAQDPDSPDNSISQYHLQSPVSTSNKFSLEVSRNEDGSFDLQLVLDGSLDRELQDAYELQVVAFDGGEPAKSGTFTVDIVVEDVNDNSPVFDEVNYKVEVTEDFPLNWTIVTVYASDPDEGKNGEVMYSFTPKTRQLYGHLFTLDPHYGTIKLKSHLDYETYTSITLGVMAQDRGSNSVPVQALVIVDILDINDNAPQITLNPDNMVGDATVQIPEHSDIDTFVAHISVVDPDGGDNGGVKCSMRSDYFNLVKLYSEEYKVVTTKVIDREVRDRQVIEHFMLPIVCADQGSQSRTSSYNLTVLIQDINDHTPQFSKSVYNVSIKENREAMSFVTRAYATDPDGGKNGDIAYIIQGDLASKFRIDPVTGVILATESFDREKIDHYVFQVVAQDQGTDARFSTAQVSVTIEDEDDEPPEFTQPLYTFQVYENVPKKTAVGSVEAEDKDLPPFNTFQYYLDPKDSDLSDFYIESTTGTIRSKHMFDRERKSAYQLVVIAQSDKIPPEYDRATVNVMVLDKNDNYPEILYPSHANDTVTIPNNVPQGHLVATVVVRDADCQVPGFRNAESSCSLTYSLDEGTQQGEFTILPQTGEILVNRVLDQHQPSTFRLVIRVSDNGEPELRSSAELMVHLVMGGRPASLTGVAISSTHLAIIVGVILGCLLIAIALIIPIFVIRRKNKMAAVAQPPPPENQLYWPRSENTHMTVAGGTESTSPTDSERSGNIIDPLAITLQGEDSVAAKLAELAEREAVKTAGYTKPKLAVLHPPPVHAGRRRERGDGSHDSGHDTDSGCADVSHVASSEANSATLNNDKVTTVAVKTFSPNSHQGRSATRKMESFSDWLHSESYHLKQEGHSYRVSDPPHKEGSLVSNGRKSVRFNTADKNNRRNGSISSNSDKGEYVELPPPPDSLQISNDSKYPPYNANLGSLV